jgi:glycosyltransferase involved in cell wall biosynthesis
LREALDSLLAQTYRHFRLVLVDDGSTDDTEAIARECAARDPRVTYIRHAERKGMTATWREAFEQATADPNTRYFAWASDHDRWDSRWLQELVAELDGDARVVLAWPHTRRIDAHGQLLDKPPRLFETRGMRTADERWTHMCEEHAASGDMVYGLMRVDPVRKAGVFRDVMCPDRLLMAELSLQGEFRQIPQELWFRRQFGEASVARQRTSLFADRGPRGRWLPPWLQHGRSLWATYVTAAANAEAREIGKRRVLQYSTQYLLKHQQKSTTYRQLGAIWRGITWTRKKVKHYVLLGVFHTLVGSRRAYHRTIYEVAIFTRRIGLR